LRLFDWRVHPQNLFVKLSDQNVVRLICPTCKRSNFKNEVALLNHCRLIHRLSFRSRRLVSQSLWLCGLSSSPTCLAFVPVCVLSSSPLLVLLLLLLLLFGVLRTHLLLCKPSAAIQCCGVSVSLKDPDVVEFLRSEAPAPKAPSAERRGKSKRMVLSALRRLAYCVRSAIWYRA
jgi:hypothetical protein